MNRLIKIIEILFTGILILMGVMGFILLISEGQTFLPQIYGGILWLSAGLLGQIGSHFMKYYWEEE